MAQHVFIISGQSNAAGQWSGTVPAHLQTADAGIKIWTGASWDTLVNGTNNQTLASGISTAGWWGPESQFAYLFRQMFPTETIYLLKAAVGSTGIAYWLPSGVGYNLITANITPALAALSSPVVDGFLWYQGEQDATTSVLANAYQANMEALDVVVKTTWRGTEATRMMVAQVNPGDGRAYLSTVRAAQAAYCAADPAGRFLNNTAAYSYQGDAVHLTATGLVSCGADMFANYLTARRSRMVWSSAASTAEVAFMAAPDIIAIVVEDPPIIPGNIVSGSFDTHPYVTWFQMTNPRSGAMEWCTPLGKDRTEVRFSDLPNPAGYINKVALRTLANWSLTGGGGVTISNVYYRDEASGQGWVFNTGSGQGLNSYMVTQRHTVYLKLSGVPTGAAMTIGNATAGVAPISYTFNDKTSRAGGIQVNHIGQRPDDAHKYGYLAARIPGAANSGTMQFAAAPYNMTTFHVLDSTKTSVYSNSIVQRVSSALTPGEGYDSGIDVADLGQGWRITGVTKGASTTTVTCSGGHGLAVNDRVRFFGISGMTQLENPPAVLAGSNWFAPIITRVDATTFDIALNSSGFTNFSATPVTSEALGGITNMVFKCFNTNRAGTYVYGLDFSAWTPSSGGTYYLHIPGYGISDPMQITSNAWAQSTAKLHEGVYTLRHGIAVTNSSGYSRGVSLYDGVNGVTNYRSTLVALFCTECASFYIPTPAPAPPTAIGSGLGAYYNAGAAFTFTSLTVSGSTITATTSAPHGITIGQSIAVQMVGSAPATYLNGTGSILTALATDKFTYTAVGTAPVAPATTPGIGRSGWVTSVRHPGRVAHQDAGDNDEPGIDHFPAWKLLAMVFGNMDKPSRFTPFTVPLSSAVLDPTLFAGTDALPPLFHEMFWFAEPYRVNQMPDGSVWGGHNIGAQKLPPLLPEFSSAIASYPETIDKYRGTDAGGGLTGQTVHAYIYARDHLTNFLYAAYAAQLAQIAYDYTLTALGDAYKASAIAAYAWADNLMTDPVARDAYYKGELNLRDKAGWTEAQYQNAMIEIDGYPGVLKRGMVAKVDAAGSLFRLLGSTTGAAYGAFITNRACTTATVSNAGTGHAVNDILTLATTGATGVVKPIRILVTAVDGGGGITGRSVLNTGSFTTAPTPNPIVQASSTGSGINASFTIATLPMHNNIGEEHIGGYDYCVTTGANATAKSDIQTRSSANPQPALCMASTMGYMGMFWRGGSPGTSGTTEPAGMLEMILAHSHYAFINGNTAARSSEFIKLMQAGANFIHGANLANKAYITGMGPRPFRIVLHEDSFKYGAKPIHGINVMGHFAWATSSMFNNFAGSTAASDGPLNYNSDNTTGLYESYATPGSAKMWNPWRGASSYWEWSPENKGIIYASEFTQILQVSLLAMELYLHGWDDNV